MASRHQPSQHRLSGYDESRFEAPVSEELKCCICTNVLNNPRCCPNEHFLCHNCFLGHLQNGNFCPVCRVELTLDTLQDPPQALTRSLAALRIHCDYQDEGCEVVVLLGELQTHVDSECEYNPANSPAYLWSRDFLSLVSERSRIFHQSALSPRSLFSSTKPEHLVPGSSLEAEQPLKGMEVASEVPGKQAQPPSQFMESQDVIVIGGRGHDGQSLTSVERFVFREGRWIELPPMNIPRSFAASVLVGNEIIVSGGDIGATITDTIETLNLDETPLQWITSAATLPVPLSAHQTVVFEGKLIVIGGCCGDRILQIIFEILLTPPYSSRAVGLLPRRTAWHGAELVNDKIFLFGGGTNPVAPVNNVVVYDPRTNECSEMPALPYRVQGMATVRSGNKVFLLGGLNEREEELDHVITYDTESGETRRLPSMTKKRGGCCAVISPTIESSGGCSSYTPTDTLVALGSLRQLNTVERFDFHSHTWSDMPSTTEARELSTAIVCPVELGPI